MQPRKSRRWIKILLLLAVLILAAVLIWRARAPRPVGISAENLSAIAPISQGDYAETVAVFGGEKKSVRTSGCGAVCMAMAIGYLTGEDVSPQTLFEWALDENFYFGDGLGHDALSAMGELHGVSGEWIDNTRSDAVIEALEAGYPVIAHMGPGTFTAGGHYILLRGIDEDGLIRVNDPGSAARTDGTYELSLIVRELRRAKSFMILTP